MERLEKLKTLLNLSGNEYDEQLEAEYDKAAAQQTPDTVRPEPEGEFERILARAEQVLRD